MALTYSRSLLAYLTALAWGAPLGGGVVLLITGAASVPYW